MTRFRKELETCELLDVVGRVGSLGEGGEEGVFLEPWVRGAVPLYCAGGEDCCRTAR